MRLLNGWIAILVTAFRGFERTHRAARAALVAKDFDNPGNSLHGATAASTAKEIAGLEESSSGRIRAGPPTLRGAGGKIVAFEET